MMTYTELAETAKASGFTHFSQLDISTLEFMQEIRDMCNPEKCRNYDRSWSCPPACASLEEMRERVKSYTHGILVQTVGDLEDSLDWDNIVEIGVRHKENFSKMRKELSKKEPSLMGLGAGGCKLCEKCTYPDEPCRHPDEMEISMEASGLFVSKVCTDNDLKYNYGPEQIAYTACFLI